MYTGYLEEFFLGADGKISYLVMKQCSRYYMELGAELTTSPKTPLSPPPDQSNWNYLLLSGDQIANVLFNQSALITGTKDQSVLDRALEESPSLDQAPR